MAHYDYEVLSKVFRVDINSPSGLSYASPVYGGKNNKQVIRKVGDFAGSKEFNNRSGTPLAWRVYVDGKHYQAHRVIWLLVHKFLDQKWLLITQTEIRLTTLLTISD